MWHLLLIALLIQSIKEVAKLTCMQSDDCSKWWAMDLSERLGTADCPVEYCLDILKKDVSTVMMKEAVSSIGRKRDPKYQK